MASTALALLKGRMTVRILQLLFKFTVAARAKIALFVFDQLMFRTLMGFVAANALAFGNGFVYDGPLKSFLGMTGETERRGGLRQERFLG